MKQIWLYAKSRLEATTGSHAPEKTPKDRTKSVGKLVEARVTKGGSHKTKIRYSRKYKRRTSRKNKSYKVRRT